jgi:predicted negative regulator of RcsB-dependent stress response
MKRRIKKQLKEDEFVSGLGRFFEFAKAWRKELTYALVGIVVLAAIWGGIQILKSAQVRKESAVLGEIFALRADLAKNPQNASKLEAFTGRGKFGRVASIQLASHWIEQGDMAKAKSALAAIPSGTRDFYYYQAQDLKAQIAILQGAFDEAVSILKPIEEAKPKEYALDAVWYRHAEALEKKGDKAEALKLYKKVQDEYPQSYFGYDAGQKVRKLEAAD